MIGSKNNALTDYDCSLCAGNMMLATYSLGIGSCWIGGAAVIQQSDEILNAEPQADARKCHAIYVMRTRSKKFFGRRILILKANASDMKNS